MNPPSLKFRMDSCFRSPWPDFHTKFLFFKNTREQGDEGA